jgi:hypothetical protein
MGVCYKGIQNISISAKITAIILTGIRLAVI